MTGASPTADGPAGHGQAADGPAADGPPGHGPAGDEPPVRVSTLEIFFDLVFAFTLTQLTAVLATQLSWLAVLRVLLIFGLLWWMYGGYAWLTNSRPPVHTAERILLLMAMAGFLVVGIAIPRGFAGYGVVLGLGYLLVVVVHAFLYYRVNANIVRIAPFNIASALLVTIAGLLHGPGGSADLTAYLLWVAALAVQLGSPLVVHPAGRFELQPSHFLERHSALLIVAIGESIAAIGIGVSGPASRGGANWQVLAIAVLGLIVAATLWWIVFGAGDEERGEEALARADTARRTAMALNSFFYGFIPLLLGLVALAAAILRSVLLAGSAAAAGPGPGGRAGQAAVLACGAALFLGGDAAIRRQLRIGPARLRVSAAALALVSTAVGVAAGLEVQLAVVAVFLVLPIVAESRLSGGLRPGRNGRADHGGEGPDAAG